MRRFRVLVVDDDPAIRETVATFLRLQRYEVWTARHGAEAIEIAQKIQPQTILLDMRMPVMDGWRFARELRARQIPSRLVVMTAAQNAQRWADDISADACLPKPFDLKDLLQALHPLDQVA